MSRSILKTKIRFTKCTVLRAAEPNAQTDDRLSQDSGEHEKLVDTSVFMDELSSSEIGEGSGREWGLSEYFYKTYRTSRGSRDIDRHTTPGRDNG